LEAIRTKELEETRRRELIAHEMNQNAKIVRDRATILGNKLNNYFGSLGYFGVINLY